MPCGLVKAQAAIFSEKTIAFQNPFLLEKPLINVAYDRVSERRGITMNESIHTFQPAEEQVQQPTGPVLSIVENPGTAEEKRPDPVEGKEQTESEKWHAEAGRKGAHRLHQLMKLGLLYEKEHGLKRGR